MLIILITFRTKFLLNVLFLDIPHFKEVIIMATNCDVCGIRTNEVKSGGGIEDKAIKIEVSVKTSADFSRDVLKVINTALVLGRYRKDIVSIGRVFKTFSFCSRKRAV